MQTIRKPVVPKPGIMPVERLASVEADHHGLLRLQDHSGRTENDWRLLSSAAAAPDGRARRHHIALPVVKHEAQVVERYGVVE